SPGRSGVSVGCVGPVAIAADLRARSRYDAPAGCVGPSPPIQRSPIDAAGARPTRLAPTGSVSSSARGASRLITGVAGRVSPWLYVTTVSASMSTSVSGEPPAPGAFGVLTRGS